MTTRMRVVETGSFTLEPQIAAHAEEMFVVLSDPAIYAHENQPPRSLEWLRTRFAKLETRLSADGREQWLNWVIRLPTSELIGYVQATIYPDGPRPSPTNCPAPTGVEGWGTKPSTR